MKEEDDYIFEPGDEDVPYNELESRPTIEEIRASAEIAIYLEDELGVDTRRIQIRVKSGVVFLQGSVDSVEKRIEIEKEIPTRPGVRELQSVLSVLKDSEPV